MPAHVHPSHVDCHPLREHLEHIQYDVATDQANRWMTPRGALLLEAMVPVLYLEKGGVYTRQLLLHTRRASILFASATMYPKCCNVVCLNALPYVVLTMMASILNATEPDSH